MSLSNCSKAVIKSQKESEEKDMLHTKKDKNDMDFLLKIMQVRTTKQHL